VTEGNMKINPREMGCEDCRWLELSQDRVQYPVLVLVVLNSQVLLSQC
jgi:hypothetical protein